MESRLPGVATAALKAQHLALEQQPKVVRRPALRAFVGRWVAAGWVGTMGGTMALWCPKDS